MRVLHIVPDSVDKPRHLFLGSTKDIRGRTEYFKVRGIPFDEILTEGRSDVLVLEKLQNLDLSQYTTALFEYPTYPASLRFLRQHFPQLQLLTRSLNAEFCHRLHYALAGVLLYPASLRFLWQHFPQLKSLTRSHDPEFYHQMRSALARVLLYDAKKVLGNLRDSATRLRLECLCARRSDYILSITHWEKDNYWRYLTDVSKVVNVPYFLPNSYNQFVPPPVEKKLQCVCLMSTSHGTLPFTLDAARRFARLVERLDRQCSEWSFFITGDFPAGMLTLPVRITRTGFLDTPFELLAESRSLALLSDFGFGFKTKLLDAIKNKCYVLVARRLYQRLPVEVQPYCIVVDPNSVESFKNALERCLQPYPDGNPNDVLRTQAFTALDELLCNHR